MLDGWKGEEDKAEGSYGKDGSFSRSQRVDLAEEDKNAVGGPDRGGCPEFESVHWHAGEESGCKGYGKNNQAQANEACICDGEVGDRREVVEEGSTHPSLELAVLHEKHKSSDTRKREGTIGYEGERSVEFDPRVADGWGRWRAREGGELGREQQQQNER